MFPIKPNRYKEAKPMCSKSMYQSLERQAFNYVIGCCGGDDHAEQTKVEQKKQKTITPKIAKPISH